MTPRNEQLKTSIYFVQYKCPHQKKRRGGEREGRKKKRKEKKKKKKKEKEKKKKRKEGKGIKIISHDEREGKEAVIELQSLVIAILMKWIFFLILIL